MHIQVDKLSVKRERMIVDATGLTSLNLAGLAKEIDRIERTNGSAAAIQALTKLVYYSLSDCNCK